MTKAPETVQKGNLTKANTEGLFGLKCSKERLKDIIKPEHVAQAEEVIFGKGGKDGLSQTLLETTEIKKLVKTMSPAPKAKSKIATELVRDYIQGFALELKSREPAFAKAYTKQLSK